MNYKAVEVIWIFLADRRTDPHTDRRTEVFQEVLADLKSQPLKESSNLLRIHFRPGQIETSPLPTLQPTVQILSRVSQEQILVQRKSQDLFSKSQELLKKLLATLKVSGALFAASFRNLMITLATLKVSGPLF